MALVLLQMIDSMNYMKIPLKHVTQVKINLEAVQDQTA